MSVTIRVKDNGSLKVEGDFTLVDSSGAAYDLAGRTAVSLCRCGHSATKPFCDKSHHAAGFVSECHAYAMDPPVQKPAAPPGAEPPPQ